MHSFVSMPVMPEAWIASQGSGNPPLTWRDYYLLGELDERAEKLGWDRQV